MHFLYVVSFEFCCSSTANIKNEMSTNKSAVESVKNGDLQALNEHVHFVDTFYDVLNEMALYNLLPKDAEFLWALSRDIIRKKPLFLSIAMNKIHIENPSLFQYLKENLKITYAIKTVGDQMMSELVNVMVYLKKFSARMMIMSTTCAL